MKIKASQSTKALSQSEKKHAYMLGGFVTRLVSLRPTETSCALHRLKKRSVKKNLKVKAVAII
jgi:hypothetical protein